LSMLRRYESGAAVSMQVNIPIKQNHVES